MNKTPKRKLKFELIPAGCWKCNLHEILSKQAWDFIKQDAKIRADGKCSICGRKTNNLDAHEVWGYDEKNAIQKLEDVIAVCRDCHNTIHIGRTQAVGTSEKAEDHYIKVSGSLILTVLAAVYPGRKAANLSPAEALRQD